MNNNTRRLEKILSHLTPSEIYIKDSPAGLEDTYANVFTPAALDFIANLVSTFKDDIDLLYTNRLAIQQRFDEDVSYRPSFLTETQHIRNDMAWKVDPLPSILQDRRVDVGDISPSSKTLFESAVFSSGAQGVQVDFDDGHCPSWSNTITGHFNINSVVSNNCDNGALLIIRPRAWNMTENNILVKGQVIPGPIVDFALFLFHNGKKLQAAGRGPFLYLSKLESYLEARLWNRIFNWTEDSLDIPTNSIKACVLIENISAVFQMEEILYELSSHCIGLNCGMWDYSASVIARFKERFIIPDRKAYVSMKSPFLNSYMKLLITTCHRRNAIATTGMVPFVLNSDIHDADVIKKAISAKTFDALAGSDGALVYDIRLVRPVQKVFSTNSGGSTSSKDDSGFFKLSAGKITLDGIVSNIKVLVGFINAWIHLNTGVFVLNGAVEDSATAEISRSQLWQWLRGRVLIEHHTGNDGSGGIEITPDLLHHILISETSCPIVQRLAWGIITSKDFPQFITTYLSNNN